MPTRSWWAYLERMRTIFGRRYEHRGVIRPAIVVVAAVLSGCSSAAPSDSSSHPHPTIAKVERAAHVAFLVKATCRPTGPLYPGDTASWYNCREHPKACDAPSDTPGTGCWAISCSVEVGLTARTGNTLDFYNCQRYDTGCEVNGYCPDPLFVSVTGHGGHLKVDTIRSTAKGDTCPYWDER
jgi:hypothetical protein